jgi:hypothetical protein
MLVAALGLLGCGRVGFDLVPDAVPPDMAPDMAEELPPVPPSICRADRHRMIAMPPLADLVIAPSSEGYAAIWVDAAAGGAHGAILDTQHAVLHSAELPAITHRKLGGIADAGQQLVLASFEGNDETVWRIARDLSSAQNQFTLPDHPIGRDPFPSDVGQRDRAFVTATVDQVQIASVAADGLVNINAASQFMANQTLTDLSCTDGPDHSHCAWVEGLGGAPSCIITDVAYMGSVAPVVRGPQEIATSCKSIRNASGPAPADSMIVVWVTTAGAIIVHYAASTGDVDGEIAQSGTAPKVRFDGSRFWIAWLDAGGELKLSSFDLGGKIVHYDLPGWKPLGPEAFELVTGNGETALALASSAGLDVLTICP